MPPRAQEGRVAASVGRTRGRPGSRLARLKVCVHPPAFWPQAFGWPSHLCPHVFPHRAWSLRRPQPPLAPQALALPPKHPCALVAFRALVERGHGQCVRAHACLGMGAPDTPRPRQPCGNADITTEQSTHLRTWSSAPESWSRMGRRGRGWGPGQHPRIGGALGRFLSGRVGRSQSHRRECLSPGGPQWPPL